MPKILIASAVKQKDAILREFLSSLKKLETDGLEICYAFIDDQESSSQLLREFAAETPNVRILAGEDSGKYVCDEHTHYWRDDIIWKVARYKDRLIALALDENFNFLFLVDSDLVLHPKTLTHLAGLGKDIVSEVYWTKWKPDLPPLPQVWLGGQYRFHAQRYGEQLTEAEVGARQREFLQMLQTPGTYKVGGLGACTLLSREALLAGVSFREIANLDLIGEDRHFCVRAAVLGFELYADTHYPPFHIYRESELEGLAEYKRRHSPNAAPTITLAMLVRNEANRYLEQVLGHAGKYVDQAVILDDASSDGTVELCKKTLSHIPLNLVSNREPGFSNEIALRKQLWDMTAAVNPDWLLILDADEVFEDRMISEAARLAANSDADVIYFRLYDMWAEDCYREDTHWCAHLSYRPFMFRYKPDLTYVWQETPLHCGRFPQNIDQLRLMKSDLRVKHFGWMRPADRLNKYYRYKKLDPLGKYGIMEQYLSILDPKPNLIRWVE